MLFEDVLPRIGDARLRMESFIERGERTFFVSVDGSSGEGREPGLALEAALDHLEAAGSVVRTVFIMSVMHTGTTFLKNVFRPDGLRHVHEQQCLTEADAAGTIAVPMRHPEKVWKSWKWRQRPEPLFWLSWHLLDWYDRKYGRKIVYVPVDLPDIRDRQLKTLAERAGREMSTDWEPRNVWKHERTEVEIPDLSSIHQYDVVRRFYP